MKEKFFFVGKILFATLIHLAILAVIFNFWRPLAQWYLDLIPTRGIDLYNSASYVSYLINHFDLRVWGWKYTWFSGVPFARDYPSLYFYLMIPLAKAYGVLKGVQIFALAANFAFVAFSYLLFATLSKNRILAAILALAVAYSVNVWRALVWAGGIPFFANQAMFPLVFYLIIKFIQSGNRRFLVLGALISGLGYMGHPQSFINMVFPMVFILLVFSFVEGVKYFGWKKIQNLILYGVVTILVALPGLYYQLFENFIIPIASLFKINLEGIAPPETKPVAVSIAEWARRQFDLTFSDTNQVLFQILPIMAGVFLLGLVIRKTRVRGALNTIVIALVAGYVIFYIYLLAIGIDIYHGGWEAWYKLFWSVPVVVGALASSFWGVFATSLGERIKGVKARFTLLLGLEVLSGAIFVVLATLLFSSYTQGVTKRIYDVGAFSGVFPEATMIRSAPRELEKLKSEIRPGWLVDEPGNFRLYDNDQTVNVWWNALFQTPLARGYIDAPVGLKGRWGIFWMDSAFGIGTKGGSSLGDDWKTPEEVVEKNTAFLLDWYAVKYLEGNHSGHAGTGSLAPALTSDRFVDKEEERVISGAILRDVAGKPEEGSWNEKFSQKLHFYKIKDDLVSPIHQATNAPAVLVIGGGDSFDITTRFLGMMGLSSQEIIVAKGPKFIDEVTIDQMLDFDALILYKYDYNNRTKAWERISKYLDKGGKVFVETGVEVKESSSVDLPEKFPKVLPEVFPVKQTKRDNLGTAWEEEIGDFGLFEKVDTENFSPLEFDKGPWNISYAPNRAGDLREGATVLLSAHGYPVLAAQEFGKGKIIWSGLNLPYHILYNYNFDEGRLLVNIFSRLFEFGGEKTNFDLNWVSPRKRVVTTHQAKGVLFKEQNFPGWTAKAEGVGRSRGLKIYAVGPSSPGFMYVRIPETMRNQESKVTFSYRGALDSWLVNLISLIAIIFSLDYILLGNKTFTPAVSFIWARIHKKTGSWWEREEEE